MHRSSVPRSRAVLTKVGNHANRWFSIVDTIDLSTVTLSQLRYVAAVDEHRSFRVAAEHCNVSQPGLSMQLQKLEEALQTKVFDRSRQPIVPTEAGQRIILQARTILREAARLADSARGDSGAPSGQFRLGIIPTLSTVLVPRFVPQFAERYPDVELTIEELQTDELVRRLLGDSLDAGLAATPLGVAGVRERPLLREPLHVYLPSGHRLLRRPRVRQSELVDENVWVMAEGHCFRTQVLHLCKADRPVASARGGSVRFHSGSFETLVKLVDQDFGLTVLPELVVRSLPTARRRARVRPFAAPVPVREVSLVHARDHLRRRIADALFDSLRDSLPAELGDGERREWVLAPV